MFGGGAFAATQLPKNSVGKKQLKANAVTSAKIKKNAVTNKKLAKNAVTGDKVKDGSLTGVDVNVSTLGTVHSATNASNSATTDVTKRARGTLALGQAAVFFEYGPFKLIAKCLPYEGTKIAPFAFIESSTDNSIFVSWEDGNNKLGPATPEAEREIFYPGWADSAGPFAYEGSDPVSATAAGGASFTGEMSFASEKDSNTCWYWFNGTIIS